MDIKQLVSGSDSVAKSVDTNKNVSGDSSDNSGFSTVLGNEISGDSKVAKSVSKALSNTDDEIDDAVATVLTSQMTNADLMSQQMATAAETNTVISPTVIDDNSGEQSADVLTALGLSPQQLEALKNQDGEGAANDKQLSINISARIVNPGMNDDSVQHATLLNRSKPDPNQAQPMVQLEQDQDMIFNQGALLGQIAPKNAMNDLSMTMETGLGSAESSVAEVLVDDMSAINHHPSFNNVNSTAANSTTMPANAAKIDVPVTDPTWRESFAERVLWASNQSVKSASIQLNPEHLGPIEVHLKVHQQQASIVFNAQHLLTKDAIEDAIPRLREMLEDNGLGLADATVSDRSWGDDAQSNSFFASERDPADDFSRQGERVEIPPQVIETKLGVVDYYA